MMISDAELKSIDALAARQAQLEVVGRHIEEYRRVFTIIKTGLIRDRIMQIASTKQAENNGAN